MRRMFYGVEILLVYSYNTEGFMKTLGGVVFNVNGKRVSFIVRHGFGYAISRCFIYQDSQFRQIPTNQIPKVENHCLYTLSPSKMNP